MNISLELCGKNPTYLARRLSIIIFIGMLRGSRIGGQCQESPPFPPPLTTPPPSPSPSPPSYWLKLESKLNTEDRIFSFWQLFRISSGSVFSCRDGSGVLYGAPRCKYTLYLTIFLFPASTVLYKMKTWRPSVNSFFFSIVVVCLLRSVISWNRCTVPLII